MNNRPYNYYEGVHSEILDYIEREGTDVTTLSIDGIRDLEIDIRDSTQNINDVEAGERISGNTELLAKVLPWACEMGWTIDSASCIDALCRIYLIPQTLQEVIAERKAVKAQEEADRAKVRKPVEMDAYHKAKWTKLFCDIALFNDWETFSYSAEDFDKDLARFLAGDENAIYCCNEFLTQMVETSDEDSADHIHLERLQKRLAAFKEYIG